MKATGDITSVWGVAVTRDQQGNLADIRMPIPENEAKALYDSFQVNALLKIDIEVVSTYDGVIELKTTDISTT